MRRGLDMDKIARALGAARQGKLAATGGYFGAMQLLADIAARFRVPSGGGHATDPNWTENSPSTEGYGSDGSTCGST